MAMYIVSINPEKWEKFYPASLNKGKKWSWGRLDSGIFDDDELMELSAEGICVLLYVMLRSSKHQRPDNIPISAKKVCDRFNITRDRFIGELLWFEDHSFLKFLPRPVPVTNKSLAGDSPVPRELLVSDSSVTNPSPASDSPVTNESPNSDSQVPNQGLYARTDATLRNEESPKAPLAVGNAPAQPKRKIGRKEMDAWANNVLMIALKAIRERTPAENVFAQLGDRGRRVLLAEYGDPNSPATWESFKRMAMQEYEKGFGPRFRSDTLRGMKDILHLSVKADSSPTLTVVTGGGALWPN